MVWNTRHFQRAQDKLTLRGDPAEESVWQHLSPLLWEYINLVGSYHFADIHLEEEFRPLRESEGRRMRRAKKNAVPQGETATEEVLSGNEGSEQSEREEISPVQLSLLQGDEEQM